MDIKTLKSVLPAPRKVSPELTSSRDSIVEGLTIPKEYWEFLKEYGSGVLSSFIWFFHPDTDNTFLRLSDQIERQAQVVHDALHDGFLNLNLDELDLEYPMIPFAVTDNGDLCCWVNHKDGQISISVFDPRGQIGNVYEMSFLMFIYGIVKRDIIPSAFPDDFSDLPAQFLSQ